MHLRVDVGLGRGNPRAALAAQLENLAKLQRGFGGAQPAVVAVPKALSISSDACGLGRAPACRRRASAIAMSRSAMNSLGWLCAARCSASVSVNARWTCAHAGWTSASAIATATAAVGNERNSIGKPVESGRAPAWLHADDDNSRLGQALGGGPSFLR
jgi:hypothetical protein